MTFTAQQTFDKVVTHLRTQGKPAIRMNGDDEYCAYRTDDGLSCAAGCLIPDAYYSPEFEDKKASALSSENLGEAPGSALIKAGYGEHLELILDMQRAHDSWSPIHSFEEDVGPRLLGIAQRHKLSPEAVTGPLTQDVE
jgi:hypothetical protein